VITDATSSTIITRPSPPLHTLPASTRNSTSVSECTLARIARSPATLSATATMTAASAARLYVSHACPPSCPCSGPPSCPERESDEAARERWKPLAADAHTAARARHMRGGTPLPPAVAAATAYLPSALQGHFL